MNDEKKEVAAALRAAADVLSYYDEPVSSAHLMRALKGVQWWPEWLPAWGTPEYTEGEGVVEVSWIRSRKRYQKTPEDRRWTQTGEDQDLPLVWPIKFALFDDEDGRYLHAEQGRAEVTVDLSSLKPREIRAAAQEAVNLLRRKNPKGFRGFAR